MSAPTLFSIVTVHCFWGKCSHTVQDPDPEHASRLMQAHYDAVHGDDLTALGYPPRTGHQFDSGALSPAPTIRHASDTPKPAGRR